MKGSTSLWRDWEDEAAGPCSRSAILARQYKMMATINRGKHVNEQSRSLQALHQDHENRQAQYRVIVKESVRVGDRMSATETRKLAK
jgi:hypothetical protein